MSALRILKILLLAALAMQPDITLASSGMPEGFVHLDTVAPSIRQDMRYYGKENFLGTRVDGYLSPRCILTKPAATALARAQAELQLQGLTFKVFDCYRPQRAVTHFLRWSKLPDDPTLRARYYPNLSKLQLLQQVYIADKSGHSRGSTVDLTIVQARTPTPSLPRERGREGADSGHDGCSAQAARRGGALDMGSGFDCFDPVSNTADASITAQQRANRQLLKVVMKRAGFYNYDREWWHYILNREPFPDTYFDFEVR